MHSPVNNLRWFLPAIALAILARDVAAEPTYHDGVVFARVRLFEAADTDGDGLTDDSEYRYRTNPSVTDTDGDGLTDGEEVVTHNTSPTVADCDADGYTDGEEVMAGTDPLDPLSHPQSHLDLDGNGLPDEWELAYFGRIGVDLHGDPDSDYLDNLEEYIYGTDPVTPDTDGDGLGDGDEVYYGHDPLVPVAQPVLNISYNSPTRFVEIEWTTAYGFSYMPQYKDDLSASVWSNLLRRVSTEFDEYPTGREKIIDFESEKHPRRFYRVIIPIYAE